MNRRRLLPALVAALLSCGVASAQAPRPLRYALLSAVGDQMTVVSARLQTGSRIDRNDREVAAMPDRALDRLVLKHVDGALTRAVPTAEVAALMAARGRLLEIQQEMLAARKPVDVMTRAFAEVLPAGGADRLLLVLKHRAEASIPVDTGTIGLGRLEGVGFYVDRQTTLRSTDTGYIGSGLLAPFAYVRLVVADASGRVLAQRELEMAETYGMSDSTRALQPWELMDAPAKVDALDRLLRRHIERELPKLIALAGP